MKHAHLFRTLSLLAVLAALAAGCSGGGKAADDGTTRVAIQVTEKGFEPASVTVPAGKPVTLVVTRKTDKTCVKELVMADQNIRRDLPLDQPVEIRFTPEKSGEIRYACGMDMVTGTIVVR